MTLQVRLDTGELTERLPLVGPHASPRPSAPPPTKRLCSRPQTTGRIKFVKY